MIPRLFVPHASSETTLVPSEDEAHYARHVLRLAPGARVRVFDGEGREWDATVIDAHGSGLRLSRGDAVQPAGEPCANVTLAIAMLKSDYMDDALRNAAMLGASAIQPVVTAHTAFRAGHRGDAARLRARWQRVVHASIRQCGRAVLPAVHEPRSIMDWLPGAASSPALKIVLAEPAVAHEPPPSLSEWGTVARRHGALLLVGPEGGWSPGELTAIRDAGFLPWTIGPRVLRADATPIAALSILLYAWEQSDGEPTLQR
jgi:16S rRNA (uracil1498-N3)-methyltransferase